uniref:Uncharacterized protein n=1 Tax=Oryza glumipatula TaxID=40148 RepID=A0A0D9Y832_9ORYZ
MGLEEDDTDPQAGNLREAKGEEGQRQGSKQQNAVGQERRLKMTHFKISSLSSPLLSLPHLSLYSRGPVWAARLTTSGGRGRRLARPAAASGSVDRWRVAWSTNVGSNAAVECLFEILRRLPGGCEHGASTCISRSWFVMEDDELSANITDGS